MKKVPISLLLRLVTLVVQCTNLLVEQSTGSMLSGVEELTGKEVLVSRELLEGISKIIEVWPESEVVGYYQEAIQTILEEV